MISNTISRVILSRRKVIWDIFEEIRFMDTDIFAHKRSKEYSKLNNSQRDNSKTEPSTEIEPQVFGKTDLDYYFIERLERMRDMGVREEDYNLIAQEEKFSLERAERSEDEDLGYVSDNENHSSDFISDEQQHSQRRDSSPLKYLCKINENNDDQLYLYNTEDLQEAIRLNPHSVMSIDEFGNSSILTIELKSLLKDCTDYSKASEMSSDMGLSKCISGN